MKRITAITACAALALAGGVTTATPASAKAKDEVELCRILVAADVFESVGECVGTFRSNPAKACENYDSGFFAFFGFKNRGECVKFLRSFN